MDPNSTLILSTDAQILLDFEHDAFGWRLERQGRAWLDRALAPLDPDQLAWLMRFQRGAKVQDVIASAGPRSADLLKSVERWIDLGLLHRPGEPSPRPDSRFLPLDIDPEFRPLFDKVKDYSLTSLEKLYALHNACTYVTGAGVRGDFAESGVWRGGSMMLCAHELLRAKDTGRTLYLYDTYEGMPEPIDKDVFLDGKTRLPQGSLAIGIEEVKKNLLSTGYPAERLVFIKGKVEETLPRSSPQGDLALLRLDTDFHDSTYHALVHLYPRLVVGGVLIMDDFGSMIGAREAAQTYFRENRINLMLTRVERSVVAIKTKR